MYEATTLRLSSYTTDLALVGANWSDVAKDVGEISATDGLLALCGGCKSGSGGSRTYVLCEIFGVQFAAALKSGLESFFLVQCPVSTNLARVASAVSA